MTSDHRPAASEVPSSSAQRDATGDSLVGRRSQFATPPSALAGLPAWLVSAGYSVEASRDGAVQCGVDIVEVDRITRAIQRWGVRFLDRVWTEHEQRVCRGRFPELAARFAGKEATSKALGTGISGIVWREIEILPDARGKPLLFLHGAARERADLLGLNLLAISLTHTRSLACAMVVAAVM